VKQFPYQTLLFFIPVPINFRTKFMFLLIRIPA